VSALCEGRGCLHLHRFTVRQQERTASLLSMVVPNHVTKQLMSHVQLQQSGKVVLDSNALIARAYQQVALCFIDICDFTAISSALSPSDAVRFLDEFFTLLDNLLDVHRGLTKVKTIGDCYFVVAGFGEVTADPSTEAQTAKACTDLISLIEFCLDVQDALAEHRFSVTRAERAPASSASIDDTEQRRLQSVIDEVFVDKGYLRINVRIGIHCGDVIAGVVGRKLPVSLFAVVCSHGMALSSITCNTLLRYIAIRCLGYGMQHDIACGK
jgi:class 3 adenylate cyclase